MLINLLNKKNIFLFLFLGLLSNAVGQNLFWVGGSGEWNDQNHWALSSGGNGGAGVPNVNTNVFFDRFSSRNQTIINISSDVSVKTIDFGDAQVPLYISSNSTSNFIISGGLELSPKVYWNFMGDVHFYSSSLDNEINFYVNKIQKDIYFEGAGSWKVATIEGETNSSFYLKGGMLDMSNSGIYMKNFYANVNQASIIADNAIFNIKENFFIGNACSIVSSKLIALLNTDSQKTSIPASIARGTWVGGNSNSPLACTVSNPTITLPVCFGVCNGTASFNLSSCAQAVGGGAYSAQWVSGSCATSFVNPNPATITGTPYVQNNICCCQQSYNVIFFENGVPFTSKPVAVTCPGEAIAFPTLTQPSCNGLCDGRIDVFITGGQPDYDILWTRPNATTLNNPGLTPGNDSIKNACAGKYYLQITDANGCVKLDSIVLGQPSIITPNGSSTPITCFSACDATATVAPTGGTGAYSYSWVNSVGTVIANTATASNLCPGTYTCTITDANGCTATYTAVIANQNGYVLTSSQTNPLCFDVCNGTATIGVTTGPTGPYTFTWSPAPGGGQGTTTATGLCSGVTYTVTISNVAGCDTTRTFTVTSPPLLVSNPTFTSPSCNGSCVGGTITTGQSGGTAGYTYVWIGATPDVPGTQSNICPGTYDLVVIDANGCNDTASVTLIDPPVINIALTPTNLSCNGVCDGSIANTTSGGTPNVVAPFYNFTWAGPTVIAAGTEDPTLLCAGTYTVTATDSRGCTRTATTVLTQPLAITLTPTHTNVTCFGANDGTANVVATGGNAPVTLVWADNAAAPFPRTGMAPGTYTVNATDATGCPASVTITITQPNSFTVALNATALVCNGGTTAQISSVVSGGTPTYTYSWASTGVCATVPGTPNQTNMCAGTYTLTVTDGNTCTATSQITIVDPPPMTVTFAVTDILCHGLCTGAITPTVGGGTLPYTYNWQPTNSSSPNQTNLCANVYTLTVTDVNGCQVTGQDTVKEPNALVLSTDTVPVTCFGQCNGSATATAVGGTAGYTYSWTPGPTAGATIINLCAATYNVTVTDANGCTASSTATVTQPLPFSIAVSNITPSCTAVPCSGGALVTPTNGVPVVSYSWSGGQNSSNPSDLCPGINTVTATDGNGCTSTISVNIAPAVSVSISSAQTALNCANDCNGIAIAHAAGGTGILSFAWDGGAFVANDSVRNNLCAGTHFVDVIDGNGCATSDTIVFTQPTALVATGVQQNVICNSDCDGYATVSIAGGTPAYVYSWSPGGSTNDSLLNLCAGTYSCIVTDNNGCKDTANFTITQSAAITANVAVTSPSACGVSDGSVTITTAGGSGPTNPTISWDGGPAIPSPLTIPNLGAGSHTIVVTDPSGCDSTIFVSISNTTGPTYSHVSTDVTCFGLCNGTATVTAVGIAPITYLWPVGATPTNPTQSGLCPNTYPVQITDGTGCIVHDTVVIAEPTDLVDNPTITDNLCSGVSNGSILVAPTGGTGAYTFNWDSGAQSANPATGLSTGPHTLIVTDANSCNYSFNYNVASPTALVSTITKTDVTCNGSCNGTINVSTSSGTGPYTYTINGVATLPSISGLCAGNYTIVTTDANGCSDTQVITIVQGLALSSGFIKADNNCSTGCTGSASFTPTGGAIPYSYQWFVSTVQSTQSVSGLCPGTYQGICTDANGCADSVTFTINLPTDITLSISGVSPSCNGGNNGTATVVASGGTPYIATTSYTYSWSPNVGTNATALFLTSPGSYTVTVTDSLGCSNTASVNLTPNPTLLPNITDSLPKCNGLCDGQLFSNPVGGVGPYTYQWASAPPLNANSQNQTNVCAGNYSLIVTDAVGCKDTLAYTLTEPPKIDLLASLTPPTCGAVPCDGAIAINVIFGTSPFTVAWIPPVSGNQLFQTSLCAGIYLIDIIDVNQCRDTIPIGLSNSNGPIVDVDSVNVTCIASCNGSATVVSVSGGTPGYSYDWTPPNSPTDADSITSGLCAGTVISEVTDAAGCKTFTQVDMVEPSILDDNEAITNATCFGINDGAITVTPSGGNPGLYSYSLNGAAYTAAAASHTFTNLSAGTNTIDIRDSKGCITSFTYTVGSNTQALYTLSTVNLNCNAVCDGMISFTNFSGGTPPYAFSWNDPAHSTGSTVSNLCAGTYTATILDATGCILTVDTVLTEAPAINPNVNVVNSTCGACNGTISINPSGATPTYTYLWPDASTNDSLLNVCAGVYNLEITDGAGCITTHTLTVSDSTAPSVTLTPTNITCNAQCNGSITSAVAGGTAPYTYLWVSTSNTTSSISGQCAGTYTLQVKDAAGCIVSQTANITEPAPMQLNPTIVNPDCGLSNGSITLAPSGGTGAIAVQWLTNPPGGTSLNAINLAANTYNIILTDGASCSDTFALNLNSSNGPIVSISSSNATCPGICDGTASITISGGTLNYSQVWSNGDLTTNPTNLCPGTYTVTVTDGLGCVTIANTSVTAPTAVSFALPDLFFPTCNNDCDGVFNSIAVGGQIPYTYAWTPVQTPSIASASALCPGNYTVTVTDANGCSATLTDSIKNPPLLVFSATSVNASCSSSNDASIDVTVSGGVPNYSYQWSGASNASTQDLNNITIGSYTQQITDANGCVRNITINISSTDSVIADAGADSSFCEAGPFTLNGSNSFVNNGTITYSWAQIPSPTVIGTNATQVVTPPNGTTDYQLTVSNGVCIDIDTISLTSLAVPTADAGVDVSIIIGQTATLGGNPTGPIGSTFSWLPDSAFQSLLTDPNPVVAPDKTVTYTVTVTNGPCVNTDSITVIVLPAIVFPNGISPNGDGKNDFWIIDFIYMFPENEVEIYNRWGELLYAKKGYDNTWDGTYKGKPLPIGTYYYVIKLNDSHYAEPYTGPITIFR